MDRIRQRTATLVDDGKIRIPHPPHRLRRSVSDHVCLFSPLHYEPGYAYPLIVWLHGAGRSEADVRHVMPHISMQNFVAVAPRGTQAVPSRRPAFRWTQKQVAIAEARVLRAVDTACSRFNVAPERIFIAGFDSGATMAYRVAFAHPDRFAGVIAACGGFPNGQRPFARLTEARQLPVLMMYGRDSVKYPPEAACADLRLFHAAGLDVNLRQYPETQHLTVGMLADINRWIMERLGAIV